MFLAPGDGNRLGMRIDAVFDEFRNRFQGVALRQRDDPNRIPVVPNSQLTAVFAFGSHAGMIGKVRPLRAPRFARFLGGRARLRLICPIIAIGLAPGAARTWRLTAGRPAVT